MKIMTAKSIQKSALNCRRHIPGQKRVPINVHVKAAEVKVSIPSKVQTILLPSVNGAKM